MEIKLYEEKISASCLIELKASVGWNTQSIDIVEKGIQNSLYSIIAKEEDKIIGYARTVGDDATIIYIQDVIVRPEYQGKGIGSRIMEKMMAYLMIKYSKGTMVCLMSAKGKERFYQKYGFIQRPNEKYGCGMIQFI
jgi:predicted N-acetyltransferase YhbS